jgi:dTDP-4-amino-4,6-dideoxygalactose transaminase
MLSAVSRYGARVLPNTEEIIAGCRRRGELIRGPQIAKFEQSFVRRIGAGQAFSTSYGRMAFFYILKAMQLPPGSEIILPALTFWVVPELARVAGLRPVFADVDPATFNLDPKALESTITPETRAVVPTHLYGRPCDMDPILAIARRHGLAVIEDCAHALGASYRGRPVGTFGDAGFFSFQTLKPLNTYAGGMALVQDPALARRVAGLAAAEPWPDESRVMRRLHLGRLQRVFTRPEVFTITAFPILWAASWLGAKTDVYLWEPIRSLEALPASYTERYSNVQAALGLAGLERLDEWTRLTRAHARLTDETLRDLPGVRTPQVSPDMSHVYYQYCVYVPDRDELVRRCIRRGIDIETLHVDVCTRLPLFGKARRETPGADLAATAVQLPIYAGLSKSQVRRVAHGVRRVLLRALDRPVRVAKEYHP